MFFLVFYHYLLYYARDSCKKWQENNGRLVWFSRMTLSKSFSSLFSFFFLWWNWVCVDRTAEYFSSLFCFCFCFFSFWAWLGLFGYYDSWILLVTILFLLSFYFFSLNLLHYAQDSCRKWHEKTDKLGLISGMTVKNFSSLFSFLFLFLFLVYCITTSLLQSYKMKLETEIPFPGKPFPAL